MFHKQRRTLITVVLILLFTAGMAISALAETTTTPTTQAEPSTDTSALPEQDAPATSTTTPSTSTPAATDPAAASTIENDTKGQAQNIHQQFNQLRKQEHQLQVQQKKLQKLMPQAELKKLLGDTSAIKGKGNKPKVRQGVVLKIETAANGKELLFIRRGDTSKVYNNYFTANLDPEKIVIYDRILKVKKTLADLKVGDVVRVLPVRGTSLILVEKIGQRDISNLPPVVTPVPPVSAPTTLE